MITAGPHDLLRLPDAAVLPADAPAWARDALRVAPWVVVRRAAATEGSIAVGVRGSVRSERYGTRVAMRDVCEVVTPEALARTPSRRDVPAMHLLPALRPLLDDTGLGWGPTGSVGFELATGQSTVTLESDLDLVVRADRVADALPMLTTLHHELRSLAIRVDCQIETCAGAVALSELVGSGADVMVRTSEGPRLVDRDAIP